MIQWDDRRLSVRELAELLDRLPPTKPVVTVIVQCYAGAFANSIVYENGDPQNKIADRHRCGFFATTKHLPSVGCTPEVNEADYRDYTDNDDRSSPSVTADELQSTYLARLKMELTNTAIERQIRTGKNTLKITTLDRLLNCESGFLGKS